MQTEYALTDRDCDVIAEKLRWHFVARKSVASASECPDYAGPENTATFRRALNDHGAELTMDDILDAAFSTLDDPKPSDLCGENAVDRTRAYLAARRRSPADQVKADVERMDRMIGCDPRWVARMGVLYYLYVTYPMLAFVVAEEVNIVGLDADFHERIERDAVRFHRENPDYLPNLAVHLDDYGITYEEIVQKITEAAARLDDDSDDDDRNEDVDPSDPPEPDVQVPTTDATDRPTRFEVPQLVDA